MPLVKIKQLQVEDLIDLAVALTVCLGIIVILILVCAVGVSKPELAATIMGNITPKEGAGVGALLFFFYLILRLVYRRRQTHG